MKAMTSFDSFFIVGNEKWFYNEENGMTKGGWDEY